MIEVCLLPNVDVIALGGSVFVGARIYRLAHIQLIIDIVRLPRHRIGQDLIRFLYLFEVHLSLGFFAVREIELEVRMVLLRQLKVGHFDLFIACARL